MTPALRPGDAVLDRPSPSSVAVGEVVTFGVNSGPDAVVTHRVNAIDSSGIKTKGDANRTADPWTVKLSDVVGTKVATLPYMGYVLVYLQHPKGVASVVTTTLALILLWQLFFPPTTPDGDNGPDVRSESRRRRGSTHRRHHGLGPVNVPASLDAIASTQLRVALPPGARSLDGSRSLDGYCLPAHIPGDRYPPILSSRSTWFPL
jgi:signal peptidase